MKKSKLVIIGSGPSGYAAAIYAARAQLKPKVISGMEIGGQLMYTADLENFPGFPQGIKGPEIMKNMKEQAEKFGSEVIYKTVTGVDFSQKLFKIWTKLPENVPQSDYLKADADKVFEVSKQVQQLEPDYLAESIIISTGATARKLGVPGEDKYLGRGVSTCAVCDAAFYQDKRVYVIGGGDSAMEDALALTKFTDKVIVVHRRDELRASQIMQERVLQSDKIEVLWNSNLVEIMGDDAVTTIKVKTEGQEKELPADGVFIAIGHVPVSTIFKDQLQLTDKGYIITARSLNKDGLQLAESRLTEAGLISNPTMTSVSGVFAAGDVVDLRYKQAITAAAMGAQTALDAERWLEQ
ncbi:MAG: FAD-dependent oxidoreductase [Patescibacteria group bacterium]|nr:FAD-dependent oxidoreductase [Patescibacteria group bacterium]